jgi:hypothetical protein
MIGPVQEQWQQTDEPAKQGPTARSGSPRGGRGPKAAAIARIVAALILASVLGCGDDNSQREQVNSLLMRIAALDLHAPPDQRAKQIAALRALPLRSQGLAHMRDLCAQAHSGLLDAERVQADARQKLDRAAQSPTRDEALLLGVAAGVATAQRSLGQAEQALGECQRNLAVLVRR